MDELIRSLGVTAKELHAVLGLPEVITVCHQYDYADLAKCLHSVIRIRENLKAEKDASQKSS